MAREQPKREGRGHQSEGERREERERDRKEDRTDNPGGDEQPER